MAKLRANNHLLGVSKQSPRTVKHITSKQVSKGVEDYFSGLSLLSSLPKRNLQHANLNALTEQLLLAKRFGLGQKGRVTIAQHYF
jgi:hypothetical protein